MAYVLPTFNLTANIWRQALNPSTAPPTLTAPCALVYGRRTQLVIPQTTVLPNKWQAVGPYMMTMDLLFPAVTDVRGSQDTAGPDNIECPAGTGRYYHVLTVDDIGKGWPNEHRIAKIYAVFGSWAGPYL